MKKMQYKGQNITLGDIVKPFCSEYNGVWRILDISGKITLISDECLCECELDGITEDKERIEQLNKICIDKVNSSKVFEVRSVNLIDLIKGVLNEEKREMLKETLFKYDYWLASTYGFYEKCYCFQYGMRAVSDGIGTFISLYNREKYYSRTLGVRAVVTLKEDVELKKVNDGVWEI